MAQTVLQAALSYAARGWRVLPIRAGTKVPANEHGSRDATTDIATIRAWFTDATRGVGIATGNGLIVLDVDPGGEETLKTKPPIPPTMTVRTPRGGRHLYFSGNGRNSAGQLGAGLDVRGEGGYVVAPPTLGYAWSTNAANPAPVPRWVLASGAGPTAPSPASGPTIRLGQRNVTLTSLAGSMRNRGATPQAIEAALRAENARCVPPLPEAELVRIAQSVGRYPPKPGALGPELRAVRASDIEIRAVRWLWPGRVPLGKLTLFGGEPGVGKSLVALEMAARISRGEMWPDGGKCPKGDVLILSAEDDEQDTIAPRLILAGADMDRVKIVTGVAGVRGDRDFSFSSDMRMLEDSLTGGDVKMIVIDPVTAYLGRGVDSHRNAEVRSVLAPAATMAGRTGAAVILISHLSKAESKSALERISGSIAFAAAPRAVWLFAADAVEPGTSVMLPGKINLARKPPGLRYAIEGEDVPRISWKGSAELDANDVLTDTRTRQERGEERDVAQWIRTQLKDGPVTASEMQARAKAEKVSWTAVQRSKTAAGVRSKPAGRGTPWVWELPQSLFDGSP